MSGLNNVSFKVNNGGLGRQGLNEDSISAIVIDEAGFGSALPNGIYFKNSNEFKQWANAGANAFFVQNYVNIVFIIADFFRVSPNAPLYVSTSSNANLGSTVKKLQLEAKGSIRQFGVYSSSSFESTLSILSSTFKELEEQYMPAVCLVSSLTEMQNPMFSNPSLIEYSKTNNVAGKYFSAVIGCNSELYNTLTSVGVIQPGTFLWAIGGILGLVSKSKVSESIAWVAERNIMPYVASNGDDINQDNVLIPLLRKWNPSINIALSNLRLYTEPVLANNANLTQFDESDLYAMQEKGYLFMRKFVGLDGTYMNEAFTLDERTSDFAKIQNVRTMQKATRVLRKTLLPELNSPIRIEPATGEIAPDVATYLEGICENTLQAMVDSNEISGYQVSIDPAQPVLSTGLVQVKVLIVPYGSADNIEVSIGFAIKVSQ